MRKASIFRWAWIAAMIAAVTTLSAQTEEPGQPGKTPAKESPNGEGVRLVFAGVSGELDLRLASKLSLTYRDPSTNATMVPALGALSGLTRSGAMDLEVKGLGAQRGAQLMALNSSFVAQVSYVRADVNFTPLHPTDVPTRRAEGGAGGNIYSGSLDYYFNGTGTVSPMVGYSHGGFGAYYRVKNILTQQVGTNLYEAVPTLDADDAYVTNVYKAGVRLKLPIQNWTFTPYMQYAANRYHINVRYLSGSVIPTNNIGLPADFAAVTSAWSYSGTGAVSNTYSMTKVPRDDKSIGGVFYMDYKRFVSATFNVRRNYSRGAWSASATGLLFVHPNFGLLANYSYAEPEITLTFNRSWMVGPVVTVKL